MCLLNQLSLFEQIWIGFDPRDILKEIMKGYILKEVFLEGKKEGKGLGEK